MTTTYENFRGLECFDRVLIAFANSTKMPAPCLMCRPAFAEAWPDAEIIQQAVVRLPRGHSLVIQLRKPTAVLGLRPDTRNMSRTIELRQKIR